MISTRKILALVGSGALAAAALAAAPASLPAAEAKKPEPRCVKKGDPVREFLKCVTLKGVMKHERRFQAIANDHGGTRASGTSGYDASARYVANRMRDAGYKVKRQVFDVFLFEEVGPSALQQLAPTPTEYVEGTDFIVTPHSEEGDVTAAVTAVDLQLGLDNASDSGCESSDFDGFPAGNIALIQRGTCTFAQKGNNAAAAGAAGVIFFNQGDSTDPSRQGLPAVTLGNDYTGEIPAISVSYQLGADLSAVSGLQMRVFSNVERTPGQTSNIIAESKHGNPNNVIMAGAHLDSVPEGPGINDNASGSSALLEVALQMAKLKSPNKVRFAWWGAEESGLVGSTYYVNSLRSAQRNKIELYLNFDMIASPNYGLFIYDGDGSAFGLVGPDGSDDIEALFERYFELRNIPSEPTAFTGRSDYLAFIENDIPAGGLFTGAEVPKTEAQAAKWGGTAGIAYDPCYHQACDTIANVNQKALRINSKAMAYVAYLYVTGQRQINAGG